jgi:NIPSNAP
MMTPETGGVLNRLLHFYAYENLEEREKIRQEMVDREKWYVCGANVHCKLQFAT